MNQIEAFSLIADQISLDFIKGHIPQHKQKPMMKAHRLLKKVISRRQVAKVKRDRKERLMMGQL